MSKKSPSYKAPEKFIAEVLDFLKETKKKVHVIYGGHGRNVNEIRKLIGDSDYSETFEEVPHMKYSRLQTYLSIKNTVVVETMAESGGNMSMMARDCLALRTIMITNYNNDILSIYPESYTKN